MNINRFILFTAFIFLSYLGNAQQTVTIGIITDGLDKGMQDYTELLRQEISALLQNNYEVVFKEENSDFDVSKIEQIYDQFVDDPAIDHIITTGLIGSAYLSVLDEFPKPCHASFVIDSDLFGFPKTEMKSSGINNLSYTELNIDPKSDLEIFVDVYDYQNLGIVVPNNNDQYLITFTNYFDNLLKDLGKAYQLISLDKFDEDFNNANIDAIYLTAFGNLEDDEIIEVISKVNERKLPSFAMFGREVVEMGALAGNSPENNWNVQVRRIAINILKTLEGANPANFPVEIKTVGNDFVINMLTAERINYYPNFDVLADADLINSTEQFTDEVYSLGRVIIEALEENLEIKVASYDLLMADKDVRSAIAEFIPQGDLSLTGSALDKKIHENPNAGKAPFNLTTDATLQQLVFSAPAISNIVINKLSKELEQHYYKQEELDVIFESIQAFLSVLLAKSNVRIQSENVSVTRSNLDISSQKVEVGYSGEADRLRWDSQFSLNKIDLSDAIGQLNSSRFSLNHYLNNDINAPFRVEEVNFFEDDILMASDELIKDYINDPSSLLKFSDFLVEEAFRNLPELKQIQSALNIQEAYLKWQKVSFGAPTIAGQFGVQHSFYNTGPNGDLLTYSRPYWNSGFSFSLPISTGGKNFIQKQKTEINIEQLSIQESNVRSLLELQIRSNLQNVAASYSRVLLSQEAAESSRQSLDIAQDSYSQGVINVTDLIDVQNAALQAEQLQSSSVYEFYLNFLSVERSIGYFYSLATEEEKQAFRDRFNTYMITK